MTFRGWHHLCEVARQQSLSAYINAGMNQRWYCSFNIPNMPGRYEFNCPLRVGEYSWV